MRCVTIVACVAFVSSPALASPAEDYSQKSIAITSEMGVVFPFTQNQGFTGVGTDLSSPAVGIIGLSGAFRAVVSGVVFGAELGIHYVDRLTPSVVLSPGMTIGFVRPLLPRLSISGAMRSVFLLASSQQPPIVQITAECALQIFVRDYAFIEPVIAVGDYHQPNAGNSGVATLIVGTGYRLGIVF